MNSVLVRAPNWLGDLVMSLPTLAAIRSSADADVAFWIRSGLAPLLPVFLGDCETIDAREMPHRGRFDELLLLTGSFRSALRGFLCGIPGRTGYRGELRSPLLTRALRPPVRGSVHHSAEYARLARAAGLMPSGGSLELPVPRSTGAGGGESASRSHIALFPGSSYGPAKLWPPDRYASVGRALSARSGLPVIAYGSARDRKCVDEVALACPGCRTETGLDLRGLAHSVREAAIAIGNDAGGTHLASALGVPCVVLFGSTDPAWTSPMGPASVTLVSPSAPPCSPCFRRTCRLLRGDVDRTVPPCLSGIETDIVIESALESMRRHSGKGVGN